MTKQEIKKKYFELLFEYRLWVFEEKGEKWYDEYFNLKVNND